MGSRAWARLGLFGESQKAAGGLQAVAGGRAPGQASCVRSTWCGCTRGGRLVAMAGAGLSSESLGGYGLFGEPSRAAGGLQAVAGGGAPWQVPRACSASCGCVRCGRLAAVAGARSGSRSCNGHGLFGEAQRAAAELLQANEARLTLARLTPADDDATAGDAESPPSGPAAAAKARGISQQQAKNGLFGEAHRAAAELLQANEGRVAWWQDASMCPGAVVHGAGGCAGRVGVCGLGRPARRAEAGERIASVGIIFEIECDRVLCCI